VLSYLESEISNLLIPQSAFRIPQPLSKPLQQKNNTRRDEKAESNRMQPGDDVAMASMTARENQTQWPPSVPRKHAHGSFAIRAFHLTLTPAL
jgi:hypothetical protein